MVARLTMAWRVGFCLTMASRVGASVVTPALNAAAFRSAASWVGFILEDPNLCGILLVSIYAAGLQLVGDHVAFVKHASLASMYEDIRPPIVRLDKSIAFVRHPSDHFSNRHSNGPSTPPRDTYSICIMQLG